MSNKKKKKTIYLDQKSLIIKIHTDGETTSNIAKSLGLAPTTVRTICNRDGQKIKDSISNVTSSSSKNISLKF